MSVRIIDTISELDDIKEVRNEWDWLVEPLTSTITLNVAHDPYALYLDSEEKTKYYGFPIMPISNSFDLPGDWETRYSFIIENHEVSHILIGDVGVGKTSWLHRFKCYLETLERTSIIYYDHHVERGRPDGKHLDKEIRLHCALTALLLKTIQKACAMYEFTMHEVFNYDVDKVAKSPENIEMSTTEFMKEAATTLFTDFNHRIFLIIDNLDEYGRDVQDTGISFSENCATWDGISPIVSLRPETYHFSQVRLRGPRHIRILPASLSELLNQRLNYLWENGGKPSINAVINRFKENKLSLTVLWSDDSIDQNPETLFLLHKKIISVITENKILDEALQHLHNFNMREILHVLQGLLRSSFFSEEIISQLKSEDGKATGPRLKEAIITTYLRGPYQRHRGKTDNYPIRTINIFDIPHIRRKKLIVGLRVLQLFGKNVDSGAAVDSIIFLLGKFGYEEITVKKAIKYLARTGLIRDIGEQKPWQQKNELKLSKTDEFIISPAGKYLITKMFNEYAFRYCEAMADICSRDRLDGESWAKDRGYDHLVFNAMGILEIIIHAAENELIEIIDKAGTEKKEKEWAIRAFKDEFQSSGCLSKDFLLKLTGGCLHLANFFQKYAYEKYANYQAQTKLKKYRSKIYNLQQKALIIHKATSLSDLRDV